MILQVMIAMIAGWINRHQQHVVTYLKEENRVLKSRLPRGKLRLSDTERRRLAKLAHPLSRKELKELVTIVTPDTLMRCYKRLIVECASCHSHKYDPIPQRDYYRLAASFGKTISRDIQIGGQRVYAAVDAGGDSVPGRFPL